MRAASISPKTARPMSRRIGSRSPESFVAGCSPGTLMGDPRRCLFCIREKASAVRRTCRRNDPDHPLACFEPIAEGAHTIDRASRDPAHHVVGEGIVPSISHRTVPAVLPDRFRNTDPRILAGLFAPPQSVL